MSDDDDDDNMDDRSISLVRILRLLWINEQLELELEQVAPYIGFMRLKEDAEGDDIDTDDDDDDDDKLHAPT